MVKTMNEDKMIHELSIISGLNLAKGTLAISEIHSGHISFDTGDLKNEERKAIVTIVKALNLSVIPF